MSVITFVNNRKEETGKTLSLVAIATINTIIPTIILLFFIKNPPFYSISFSSVTGIAPSFINLFVPIDVIELIFPGTAYTFFP